MAEGGSFESFGGVIMVCEKTLYNWRDANPEFLQAKALGTLLGLKWFEERGKLGMSEQFFKPAPWSIMLRNRFRKVGELSYDNKPGIEAAPDATGVEVDESDDGL